MIRAGDSVFMADVPLPWLLGVSYGLPTLVRPDEAVEKPSSLFRPCSYVKPECVFDDKLQILSIGAILDCLLINLRSGNAPNLFLQPQSGGKIVLQ